MTTSRGRRRAHRQRFSVAAVIALLGILAGLGGATVTMRTVTPVTANAVDPYTHLGAWAQAAAAPPLTTPVAAPAPAGDRLAATAVLL